MKKLSLAIATCMLAGCGGDKESISEVPTLQSCEISAQNQYVYDVMKDSYLWADQVRRLRPKNYDSPQALLNDITENIPDDIWSTIFDSATAFDGRSYYGYGFNWYYADETQETMVLQHVYENSPAGEAGLSRSQLIYQINGKPVSQFDSYEDISNELDPAEQATFTFADANGEFYDVTLDKDTVTTPPVLASKVINVEGIKYGYLAYNLRNEITLRSELSNIFESFESESVDEIILDLRYSWGGYADYANYLASLIGGENVDGEVFAIYRHSDKYADKDWGMGFEGTSTIGYDKLTVITSSDTCGAGEVLINALSPFIDVQTVGDTTCGNPYGSYGYSLCEGLTFIPIEFQYANASDFSDFTEGFSPQCDAQDDTSKALGDESEEMLNAAITYTRTGQCLEAPSGSPKRTSINKKPKQI